jgi:hypothetical protein
VREFGECDVRTALPRRLLATVLLDANDVVHHRAAMHHARTAVASLSASIDELLKEVDVYKDVPKWAFWRKVPENYGVLRHCAIQFINLQRETLLRGCERISDVYEVATCSSLSTASRILAMTCSRSRQPLDRFSDRTIAHNCDKNVG